jgi:hypothetical protein
MGNMNDGASIYEHEPDLLPIAALQAIADVVDDGTGLAIALGTRRLRARRSLGCLIEPVPGDSVLVAIDNRSAEGIAWVLTILERTAAAPARITLPGDVCIDTPAGRLQFAARDGIELVSTDHVDLLTGKLNVQALEAKFTVERATYTGMLLRACVTGVKVAATTFDSVLDRLTQRVRQSLRRVEELDQVHAQQIDYQARDTMALHGQNTLMTADRLVKVDGASIHVG